MMYNKMFSIYSNGATVYITTDGKMWFNKEDAEDHQKSLDRMFDK